MMADDSERPCMAHHDGNVTRMMVMRVARPASRRSLPLSANPTVATSALFACPTCDGPASSPYQTNPHYNRPRKEDQS